jgi:hypothetical protein
MHVCLGAAASQTIKEQGARRDLIRRLKMEFYYANLVFFAAGTSDENYIAGLLCDN